MKFLSILSLLFLVTIFSTGCDGFLSNVKRSDQLATDEVFKTADDLEAAIVGAYHGVQSGRLLGRNTVVFADLLTANVNYRSGAFLNVALLQMDPTDFYVENLWSQGYKTINHLNAILEVLPEVLARDVTLTEGAAGRIKGEALFLRGVIYFEMVRLFCQPINSGKYQEFGLPLMLEPIWNQEQFQFPFRASIAEVYAQVTADLEEALNLLPQAIDPYRANRFVAIAYLARIAFQQEDYLQAAALADTILKSGQYSLTTTPAEFFIHEGSAEEIWAIYNEPGNDIEGLGLSSIYHPSGPNEAFISSDLRSNGFEAIVSANQIIALPDPEYQIIDLRVDTGLLSEHPLITVDTVRTNKYEKASLALEDDTPLARLAEFILMRSEALVWTNGINKESVDLLNQIRERALRVTDTNGNEIFDSKEYLTYEVEDFFSPEDLIEAIILERRVELAFEGNYFHDLMRLQRPVKGRPFNAPELRLPIPQQEMDANPNLVQNPGY